MRLEDFPDETCPQCGKAFESRRIDQKYCSARCRLLQNRKFRIAVCSEERRRARAGRTCPQCGVTFDANKGDQLYCSERCYRHAIYDKRRKREGKVPLADALAALMCQRCGGPIPGAKSTRLKYCPPCRRAASNELSRIAKRRARRKQAEARARDRA